ncbi:MAG: ABC transporter ATP-binding protein [Lachnospiraceae bacterium]|nr:ABC transporter ATP-binding protein [Lachnospiraceae bacterium]
MEERLEMINTSELVWQPNRKKEPVLNHIDLKLEEGCFYGILGPNGAGKTSLVRQLLKLRDCTSGQVFLDEKNIREIKRNHIARKLAFLPQIINSSVDFTVEEVVAMGREPYRKGLAPLSSRDKQIIEEAMSYTDCDKLRDKSISFISGGERQRVMIARTIAQDTPWIILDEPVSSLDITHQTQLMRLLDNLRNEKNKTVVAILHDINLSTSYCTHLVFMKEGKVFKEGTVEELLTPENLKELYDMEFEFVNVEGRERPYVVPRYS